MLQSVTEYNGALQSIREYYKVLQSITKYYKDKSSASTWTNFWACFLGRHFELSTNVVQFVDETWWFIRDLSGGDYKD